MVLSRRTILPFPRCILRIDPVIPIVALISLSMGCAPSCSKTVPFQDERSAPREKLEETWGVHIESLRLSASGHLIDFRYRIIDPDLALPLVDRKNKAYLLDEASGTTLNVPSGAKVGPLRQTVRYGKPKEGRVYFVLFENPGAIIKAGSRVAVVIGDFTAANLVVE